MESFDFRSEKKKEELNLPERAIKVLANSIYQNLKSEGCKNKDIIGVSSQLLSLVTVELSNLDRDK